MGDLSEFERKKIAFALVAISTVIGIGTGIFVEINPWIALILTPLVFFNIWAFGRYFYFSGMLDGLEKAEQIRKKIFEGKK